MYYVFLHLLRMQLLYSFKYLYECNSNKFNLKEIKHVIKNVIELKKIF